MPDLSEKLAGRLAAARVGLDALSCAPVIAEQGTVAQVGDGVVTVVGLYSARLDELLAFEGGARAVVVGLDRRFIRAVMLDRSETIASGAIVHGTGAVVKVPTGHRLLGRIVDPLGRPRDGGPAITAEREEPVQRPAPAIVERDFVVEPLLTGVLAIDALIPIGRGQRQLIIGDRSTGKTALAVDAILNQRRSDVVCVYVAVGQKMSAVHRVVDLARRHGPFERCVFVVAEADDPAGLQWIAPYAACTMAEAFRDEGGHALLVIDDLSKHAIIHRQVSLLLRRAPGREAYPGDVFYMHSRLLERAAKLSPGRGGGSLTALPIAETQAGNISAYIPTNLISITDGQIYLESKLFHEGQKPAINIGLSVSRVGGKTQGRAVRTLAERLKLEYAQFLELEIFTRFGQLADERTRGAIARGRCIRTILQQPQGQPLSLAAQIAQLTALHDGMLDALPRDAIRRFKDGLDRQIETDRPELADRVASSGDISDSDSDDLRRWIAARIAALSAKAQGQA